ncbi:LCP family protein [Kitasatospora sp. NPDC052896]|uniref:LCP family protein n=1 Tax=Kitasatospora sp. NPDC052896 TaxID=3364061 RepID=UPI0037C709F1
MADQQQEKSREVRGRRSRVLRAAALTLSALVLAGAGVGGYAYWRLDHDIRGVDIDGALGGSRPAAPNNGSFNVLVLGSDSRSGPNGALAGGATDGTARSDTAMVLHVNQDHTLGTVVSIPRDTLVARPACTAPDGTPVPPLRGAMFNSAYEVGGAACAVKTAEQLTGLRMDHYLEIDFSGFANFINAIGGVTVTTTVDIHDQDSGLDLKAGTTHLDGTRALAFARTRHGVGDGGDLGRIELQKELVRSVITQVESVGLFANPARLWTVGTTLTRSITTDSRLASVSALTGLGDELKGIGTDRLTMVTMPVVTAPDDPDRLVPQLPSADRLWAALRADRPVPPAIVGDQPSNPADATPSGASTATPPATPPGAPAGVAP